MRRVPAPVLWLALVLLAAARPAVADEPPAVSFQLSMVGEISPVGDATARVTLAMPAAAYAAVKGMAPDPRRWIQDLAPNRSSFETVNPVASYDDAQKAIVLSMQQRGLVRNRGDGRWELEFEMDATLAKTSPEGAARPTAWFTTKGDFGGTPYQGEIVVTLPAGATEAGWDAARKVLSYRLRAAPGTGAARLTAELRARDRIMSTIYKVYGLGTELPGFWIAKTVFRNEGTGVARGLRIRYRLQGYSEWTPWEKVPEVVPGQTVVSVLHPVLDASIARLKSNTPANLLLEWTYDDGTGRKVEDDDARKLVLLGVNEYVFGNLTKGESSGSWQEEFNNAPLLAAWVSRNDGAVKHFAAMANRNAGGVGAGSDDASALRVLRACYELMQRNDFTYQHPPALTDRSVSFDAKGVQNVKFPRETMRDRSGTCIDLAILYAAMVNAVGLHPLLVLIPGHCFPVVKLPSGRMAAVETTGVQGGLRVGSASFDQVLAYGEQELAKAQADGRIYLIDVRELWTQGISNPELEDLPADILQRWGLSEEGKGGPTPGPGPGPGPAPSGGPDALLGVWGGTLDSSKIDDELALDAMKLGVERDGATWRAGVRMEFTVTKGGNRVQVVATGIYERGSAQGGAVRFASTPLERTVVSTGEKNSFDGNPLVLSMLDDGRIHAVFEGEGGFSVSLVRAGDGPAPTPSGLDALAGAYGGGMGKSRVESNVLLDEMYVDLAKAGDGTWTATLKLLATVEQDGGIPIEISAEYRGGREVGGELKFPRAPWHRAVPRTGQRDDLTGYPMTVSQKDGGIAGAFEGAWTFTLARRGGAPEADTHGALLGAFGGGMGGADLGSGVKLDEMYIDVSRARDGSYTADVRMNMTVSAGGGTPIVVRVRCTGGQPDGESLRFPKVPWERTVPATGATSQIEGNPLLLTPAPGGLKGIFEGSDGFNFTLQRRGDAPPTRTAPPPAANPTVGAWGGRIDATVQGVFVETLTIDVEQTSSGLRATLRSTVRVQNDAGQTVRVEITSVYAGPTTPRGLSLRSISRTAKRVSDGYTQDLGSGSIDARVEGGKLVGTLSDADGSMPFTLLRR